MQFKNSSPECRKWSSAGRSPSLKRSYVAFETAKYSHLSSDFPGKCYSIVRFPCQMRTLTYCQISPPNENAILVSDSLPNENAIVRLPCSMRTLFYCQISPPNENAILVSDFPAQRECYILFSDYHAQWERYSIVRFPRSMRMLFYCQVSLHKENAILLSDFPTQWERYCIVRFSRPMRTLIYCQISPSNENAILLSDFPAQWECCR